MTSKKHFAELESAIIASEDGQLINDFRFLESEIESKIVDESISDVVEQDTYDLNNFSRFIQTLLRSVSSIHMFHMTTNNFASHIALKEYYEEMPDAIDKLAELLIPYFGITQDYNIEVYAENCPIEFLTRLRLYIVNSNFASSVEGAQGLLDNILNIIDACLYKLGRFSDKIENNIRMFSVEPNLIQIKLDNNLEESVEEVSEYIGDLVDDWDQDKVELLVVNGDNKAEFSISPTRNIFATRKYYLWIDHDKASGAKAGNLKSQQGVIGPCDPSNVGKDGNLEYLEFDNKADRDYYVDRYIDTIVMDYGPGVSALEDELSKLKYRKV